MDMITELERPNSKPSSRWDWPSPPPPPEQSSEKNSGERTAEIFGARKVRHLADIKTPYVEKETA